MEINETVSTLNSGSAESTASTENGEVSALVTKENRNALRVYCPRCGSLIISPSVASYVPSKPYALPLCRQKKDGVAVEKEHIEEWWCIEKMLDFDNIGFTHASEGVKYLICADCEVGPVGYLSLESHYHYIALSRITHTKPDRKRLLEPECTENTQAEDLSH